MYRFRQAYYDRTEILLEQNYRSTQNILDAARAVIDLNPSRTAKALHTDIGDGELIKVYEANSEKDELEFVVENIRRLHQQGGIEYQDFAVMYRTNVQAWPLAQIMLRRDIPYERISNLSLFDRMEIRDVMAYLRLIADPDNEVSFERIVNVPARGIGAAAQNQFANWVESERIGIGEGLERLSFDKQVSLGRTTKRRLKDFADLIVEWRQVAQTGNLASLFDSVVSRTKYVAHLKKKSKYEAEFEERKRSLQMLRGMLLEAEHEGLSLSNLLLSRFMQDSEAQQAHLQVERVNSVKLMTLHAAKGTEYPVVFLIGVEHDLLPHYRAYDEDELGGIEEERRLFYVGITRAKQKLFLSYATQRGLNGEETGPSEFLSEIPDYLLKVY